MHVMKRGTHKRSSADKGACAHPLKEPHARQGLVRTRVSWIWFLTQEFWQDFRFPMKT